MPQPEKKFDVVAIGAVCIDAQITADDKILESHGIKKGFTNAVSHEALEKILSETQPKIFPGGAATNVASGIALRGGKAGLIGKIANDEHGRFFAKRVQGHDVSFTPVVSPAANAATTCVAVLTTPDKERSFAFTKGTAHDIVPEDVDQTLVEQAKITYLDSYLWLSPTGKDTVHHAAAAAKQAGGKVAIALNDADIVRQNQKEFLALAKSHGDILVGDQREFSSLFGTATLEETLDAVKELGITASITAGAKGAYIVENSQATFIPSNKVKSVVDTNGAGDQFAAGFLYGLAQGKSAIDAGKQAALWASDVIQHTGAEPRVGKNAAPVVSPAPSVAPKKRIA